MWFAWLLMPVVLYFLLRKEFKLYWKWLNAPVKPSRGGQSDDLEYLFLVDNFIQDMNGTSEDSSWLPK